MPRILVIDDDEQMRNMVRKMLERAGYEVMEASDGRKGLRVCAQAQVDLVITDVIMPEMEGLELIMELRRDYPEVKIIAISGGARIQPSDYLKMAATFGAQKTFTKPFDRQEFLEAVKELVG